MSENDLNVIQYQIVVTRRQTYDSMLWQTPVISLTAQAFLFTIAVGSDSTIWARKLTAALALIISIASMQLLAKHRHHEIQDSKWLERFEKENKLFVLHEPRYGPEGRTLWKWFLRRSSYRIWLIALSSFAAGALIVLLFPYLF